MIDNYEPAKLTRGSSGMVWLSKAINCCFRRGPNGSDNKGRDCNAFSGCNSFDRDRASSIERVCRFIGC